jgi:hypothetical protein
VNGWTYQKPRHLPQCLGGEGTSEIKVPGVQIPVRGTLSVLFFPRMRLRHGLEPLAKDQALRHIRRHHKNATFVFSHVEKITTLFGRCAAKKPEDQ